MGDVVLVIALFAAGTASLLASYAGWRAIRKNPSLRGQSLRELARERWRSPGGKVWLGFLALAVLAGATGGLLLAMEVQEGRDRHLEERRGR